MEKEPSFRNIPELVLVPQRDMAEVAREEARIDGVEMPWMADRNCADKPPGFMFPEDGPGVERAQKICASCVVKAECLEFALATRQEHGVWGGASERQRKRILINRRTHR